MTYDNRQFYIDGAWVDPIEAKELKVINPATEQVSGVISMGSAKDVDRAVAAARRAFERYSVSTPDQRIALLERILTALQGALRGDCGGDFHRNGRTCDARERLSGGRWCRSHHGHDRSAQEFQVRGAPGQRAPGPGTGRRVRADHTLELADQSSRGEGGPCARGRMHDGAQALGVFAVQRHPLGSGHARGRRACGCVQPGQWRWHQRGCSAVLTS